jgi:RNA polymerase sigma factor (sigma-70 family)
MGEMQPTSDAQLLRDYAEHGVEAAFAKIVARHTDLVYSAAVRQVYSPDLARDVTQSVFTDLARKARSVSANLSPKASLVGWLYRGTRFAARDLYRNETRRTQRERQAMEQLHPASETPPDWEQLRPALDDAMSELDDTDRDAVLLRYFKNHDLRTVGATLGISDDAAQKRVSRAVERLREFFAKRGVTVGASGLAVIISANAVQAAPVGLALTLSTAAALDRSNPRHHRNYNRHQSHRDGFGGGDCCGGGEGGSGKCSGGGNRERQTNGCGLHGVGGDDEDQSARADGDAAFGEEVAQAFHSAARTLLRGFVADAENLRHLAGGFAFKIAEQQDVVVGLG